MINRWVERELASSESETRGVRRKFPVIHEWEAKATFYILDESITKDVFERYLTEAGKFIGVGRFRPRNGGFYGRFHVGDDMTWEDA